MSPLDTIISIYLYLYPISIYLSIYSIYLSITIYIWFFQEKEKQIIIESISATAFINSFLSASHFSLMIHFKTNLQVIIDINEHRLGMINGNAKSAPSISRIV